MKCRNHMHLRVCAISRRLEKRFFFFSEQGGNSLYIHLFLASHEMMASFLNAAAWVKNWKHLLVLAFWPKSEISEISNTNVGRAVKRNIPNKYLLRCTKSKSTHELECIQVFGEIFLNTTPQHNLPFELPSKNYSLPAHFLNFSSLVLYVSVRACVIQKRTLYS